MPSADPIEYTLKTLPDALPTVSILSPAMNLDVTDKAAVPLMIQIGDDYHEQVDPAAVDAILNKLT